MINTPEEHWGEGRESPGEPILPGQSFKAGKVMAKELQAAGLATPARKLSRRPVLSWLSHCCSVKDLCPWSSTATFRVGLSFFWENLNLPTNTLTDTPREVFSVVIVKLFSPQCDYGNCSSSGTAGIYRFYTLKFKHCCEATVDCEQNILAME